MKRYSLKQVTKSSALSSRDAVRSMSRFWQVGVLCIVAIALLAPAAATARLPSDTASPCSQWPYGLIAPNRQATISIPASESYYRTDAPDHYDGIIVSPPNLKTPGGRAATYPAVIVMHGNSDNKDDPEDQNECSVFWIARLLADHGYVALVVEHRLIEVDDSTQPPVRLRVHENAIDSAIAFLSTSANPFQSFTDASNIGLVGYSLGAAAVSYMQSVEPAVKAIAALDNMRLGDPDDPGLVENCTGPYTVGWTPVVPALGLASEHVCPTSGPSGFTEKRFAFLHWYDGTPHRERYAMEAVLAGFDHGTFAGLPHSHDHATQLKLAGYYIRAWLDVFLKHQSAAVENRLMSDSPAGQDICDALSIKPPDPEHGAGDPADAFQSSAFLPGHPLFGDFRAEIGTTTC